MSEPDGNTINSGAGDPNRIDSHQDDDNIGNRVVDSDDGFGNEIYDDDEDDGNLIAGGTSAAALEYIAKSIVDDSEAVVVEVSENANSTTLSVHVASDDKGKIIGKRGRVANSVRTLIRAIGAREGQAVTVDIAD